MNLQPFYQNKRIFLTGHTGFKGAWLCKVLQHLGAEIYGYALAPNTTPNLYTLAKIDSFAHSVIADIRDLETLQKAMNAARPDVVIHMAAQPLVRESYRDPVGTYAANVMGTVNILEAARHCDSVETVLNVTTDKVYKNNEWEYGYRETDTLDGYDPYSNSKSCSELVTASYKRSFFPNTKIITARAGNVIGGGDFSEDRIIPDCVRFSKKSEPIIVRNPHSIRPYQHVLEPIFAYLLLAAKGAEGSYNVGPDDVDCVTTGDLVELFCKHYTGAKWVNKSEQNAPHEAGFLRLDTSKIKRHFGWNPKWHIDEAVQKTVAWYRGEATMEEQIKEYIDEH